MKVVHDKKEQCFFGYVDEGKTLVGELKYMIAEGNELYATETTVFQEYEGHGYARELLDALADFARSEHTNIVPICPYVIAVFRKYPEKYSDVIKKRD